MIMDNEDTTFEKFYLPPQVWVDKSGFLVKCMFLPFGGQLNLVSIHPS
jgi:hypothetical protein